MASISPRRGRSPGVTGAGDLSDALLFALGVVTIVLQLALALGAVVPVGVAGCAVAMALLLRERVFGIGRVWLLAIYPLFVIASTFWSPDPGLTFRYALQLGVTLVTAFLLIAAMDLRRFILVLFLASAGVCVASYLNGTTAPYTKGLVVVGYVGSKNGIASCAHMAMFSGIAVLFDRGWPRWLKLAAVAAIGFSLFIISVSYAASVTVVTALSLVLIPLLLALHAVPRQGRLASVLLVLAATLAVAPVLPMLGQQVQQYVFKTFDKDPTLTGRTYLWQVADQWIADRPIIGWGYRYQWLSGSPGSIGILRSQQITDARVFSVHQTYLDAWIDLGVIGLTVLVLTFLIGMAAALWQAAYAGGMANVFSAVYLIGLIARSTGETLLGPFYAYGTIMFALFGYALLPLVSGGGDAAWRRRYRRDAEGGSGQAVMRRML